MLKQFVLLTLTIGCAAHLPAQVNLYSPDSTLRLELNLQKPVTYSLYAGSNVLLKSSRIDIDIDNKQQLAANTKGYRVRHSKVRETVVVPVPYRRKQLANHYNALTISLRNNFTIEFRQYNNGMAYRIGLNGRDSVTITSETAQFNFDDSVQLWYAKIDKAADRDRYHSSFEGQYVKRPLTLFTDSALTYAPIVASLPNGYHLAISDANLYDYPGMFLQKDGTGLKGEFAPYPASGEMTVDEFPQSVVRSREQFIARTSGTRMLPWRAVLVAKQDIDLPANDILYLLGDPPGISDPSWIRTGKGTDEWICGINLFNVPFRAGVNTATYKYYIDFAKRFGFDQVMLDAGWSNYKDLFDISPAINMDSIAAYAKANNIRLMLWTLSSTLDRQLDSALNQFNKWGVESIMTDFMDRDDQKMVNFYHRIAKACADHRIAVMFHGAYPPKGLNRTWPNVITHEGTLGAEWNIWSDLATPEHNVALAYIRMPAGPMDYEPGLLLNAQKDQFRAIGRNPMSQGTRSHQLAMFITYDSPLQIFSGNPSQGLQEAAFMEFLGQLPVLWDDTKILQGRIGEFIVTARATGRDWYIAGMNNSIGREIEIPTAFLKEKNYRVSICKDGINADSYAADYELYEQDFVAGQPIRIKMAVGGGFVIRLQAINN